MTTKSEVEKILQESYKLVEEKRRNGWTKSDFALALKELLDETQSVRPENIGEGIERSGIYSATPQQTRSVR